jgi:hypothetical protein
VAIPEDGAAPLDGGSEGTTTTVDAPPAEDQESGPADAIAPDLSAPVSDAGADAPLADVATTDATTSCAAAADGIGIDDRELAGYPSYAVEGCRVAYVAPPADGGSAGQLWLRDLAGGGETLIAPAAEAPRRPALSAFLLAWEATVSGKSVVRVLHDGTTRTIEGPYEIAGEPRVTSDAVVFTAWTGSDPKGDSDVFLYVPATGELTPVATGPGQQRFADVSDSYVAVSDFSEDPDGRYDGAFDLSDIVVYDRASKLSTTRKLPDKQAFPLLAGGSLVAYLEWTRADVHPEPKFAAYHLKVGSVTGAPGLDRDVAEVLAKVPPYVRPAARGGVLEWVDSPDGSFRFWRAPADGTSAPVRAFGPVAQPLFAPAPSERFTLLATRPAPLGPVTLASVLR